MWNWFKNMGWSPKCMAASMDFLRISWWFNPWGSAVRMDYLSMHGWVYANDFCIHFRLFIFIVSHWFPGGGEKRFSSGITADLITACRVCIGLSRSVPAFSDNAQDLSIVEMQSPILARMRALFCDHHKWPHDLCACPIWPYLYGWILMILREWIDWRQPKKKHMLANYTMWSQLDSTETLILRDSTSRNLL